MNEGVVPERWGSHWRWRVALMALFLGLLIYAYVLAEQWRARTLVPSHAGPAVIRVVRRYDEWLEAFDWKTGKRWKIADLGATVELFQFGKEVRVVLDGTAVAWYEGSQLHLVDIQPPHRKRVFEIPFAEPEHVFLGMSADARFGVFQATGSLTWNAGKRSVTIDSQLHRWRTGYLLSVVDLETGEVTDKREWESTAAAAYRAGEFTTKVDIGRSDDPDEPKFGRWMVSPAGDWKRIDLAGLRSRPQFLGAKDSLGQWRLIDNANYADPDERSFELKVLAWAPSGERCVARTVPRDSCVVIDAEYEDVFPLEKLGSIGSSAAFLDDSRTIVAGDLRDDIQVIDSISGERIAWEKSGSKRRGWLWTIAAALGLTAAVWLAVALRERNLMWGLVDSVMILLAIQFAAVINMVAWNNGSTWDLYYGDRRVQVWTLDGLMAMNAAAAIVVGWYWALGRGFFAWRCLFGLGWMLLLAVPIAVATAYAVWYAGRTYTVSIAYGAVSSTVTGLVVALFRGLRWTIREKVSKENSQQFGLASFFVVISGICVALAAGTWFYGNITPDGSVLVLQSVSFTTVILPRIEAVAGGILLVAILFSRARWYVLTIAATLLMAAAGVIVFRRHAGPSLVLSDVTYCAMEGLGVFGGALAIGIPCLVLRAHGWHWVRVGKVAGSSEAALNLQTI